MAMNRSRHFATLLAKSQPRDIFVRRESNVNVPTWLKALTGLKTPKVRQIGDPLLRKKAMPVQFDYMMSPEFNKLVETMIQAMKDKKGVGIAAPQVGASLRVIAIEFNGNHLQKNLKKFGTNGVQKMQMQIYPLKVVINPEMKIIDPTTVAFKEGCLSMEGYSAIVPRMKEIQVSGFSRKGEKLKFNISGWMARIFQHEIDHLDGHLYVDSMQYKTLAFDAWKDHTS
eukprot:Seg624.3 transcript_id=Seg624.3/GoldUCD/mRNA.D3Y31 product="Peptide deformylase mitochondrial" protein_id=Seg624.3/GoldUCD/D3Y31